MCFYNGIVVNRAEHIKLLKIEKEIGEYKDQLQRPMQSGFAFGNWPVIRPLAGGQDIELVFMHWELIPFYIRTGAELEHFRHGGFNPKTGKKDPPRNTLNAIGEEMLEKVSYKQAALKRRCLVLSSGFYEWRHFMPPGTKKDIAYPYHIRVKDREYFFMGGIWQSWTDQQTGETMDTFAIVTTAANALMEKIHNKKKRMPLILPEEQAYAWIQDSLSPQGIHELSQYHIAPDALEAWTIRKDFRELAEPREREVYPELPEL
jgi:putative SOS response-associated peptidase YedK